MNLAINKRNRFITYILVGGTAFLVELIVFILLMLTTMENILAVAQTASFIAGLVVSFTGSRLYTFNKTEAYSSGIVRQIYAYVGLAMFNLFATNVIIQWVVGLGASSLLAKVSVMCMVVLWNYTIFNKFIFRAYPKSR